MSNVKKIGLTLFLTLVIGAGAWAMQSSSVGDCCCDFSDGRVVCAVTGEELISCCCK